MLVELKNVSKYYNSNGMVSLGLRNINLKFNLGEIIAITGDSGSGKSTLLNVITGVDTYEEGEIYYFGNETSYFNQDDMDVFRKNNVSFIFQNYNIIESYTVLQNVMIPLLLVGKTRSEAKEEATRIIEKVGLIDRIHNKGSKLSGGEKQRCVIARALANNTNILACDEPTGNLDSTTGNEIIKLIKEVAKDKLVLIVTHNFEQVEGIVTRKIKISDGEVVEDTILKPNDNSSSKEEELNLSLNNPTISTKVRDESTEELANKSRKQVVNDSNANAINLENRDIQLKTIAQFAGQNIVATPKKTLFSLIVFMVISFVSLLLCLMMMEFSYEIGFTSNNSYPLVSPDRVIAFNNLHTGIDQKAIESVKHNEIFYNNFYESIPIQYSANFGYRSKSFAGYFTKHKINYSIVRGNDTEKDLDCVIILPSSYTNRKIYDYEVYIGHYLQYGSIKGISAQFGLVSGVAVSDEILEPFVHCDIPPKNLLNYLLTLDTQGYYTMDGNEPIGLDFVYNVVAEKSYILCPVSLKDRIDFYFLFGNLYKINVPVEVIYEDALSRPRFIVQDDYAKGQLDLSFDQVYEAAIYTSSPKEVKKKLEHLGIECTIPSRQDNNGRLNAFVLYLFIAVILITLTCLFFVSYLILSRIYASKNKDYGILRTLGMVKKKLNKIVLIENVGIALISAILSLALFFIVNAIYPILNLIDYFSVGIVFLYFGIMILFGVLIALKFNKRLFKNSVNTTLKGEVASND